MYIAGMKVDTVRTSAEGPEYALGTKGMSYDGKVYKYVQYDTAAGGIAAVAGNVAYYYAPGGVSAGSYTKVTSDLSDSAGLGAGVLQAVIADEGYDPVFGARPLKRVIQDRVLDPLSMEIIEGRVGEGDTVTIDVKKGEVVFTKHKPSKK